ncbi:MAG: flagellar hook-length control protein FliK, partial [Kiritimatiellae bacterium]|nr:flagellar hook-length control protein FliK [Kiritimatiellia bacterium]
VSAVEAATAARAVSPARALVEAADAVAAAVQVSPDLAKGAGEIRIQLRPDVLGGSAVQISVSGNDMAVVFHPATPDVSALLQVHAPELAALLSERVPSWHASVAVRGANDRRAKG